MSIPTYEKFIEPLLRELSKHPDGLLIEAAHEVTAKALGLTSEQRESVLASGQPVYRNRSGWAHDRLKRAGLSSSPRRGLWQITSAGIDFLKKHPTTFPPELEKQLATAFMDVRLRQATQDTAARHNATTTQQIDLLPTTTPVERIDEALSEIRLSVSGEILDSLARVAPSYFETIVLDLLHRMGYGANREDLVRVGGSGDGGIDGVISLDRLGLEKVYVQAKRWQGSVGSQEIQGFYGALAGNRANKGVFITTSTFTKQALTFAAKVDRIVLVDGQRLAQLMIDHEVGVSSRSMRIPRVDGDYFEGE
jgi:restriction system protein